MKTGYKVVDAMTRMVVTVSPTATIQECSQIMNKEGIGSVVIKDMDAVKGIMTEQDIVRKVVAAGKRPESVTVKEVMERRVISVDPGKDIHDALVIMRDGDIRHLPVVDNGKLLGILTVKDILKVEPELINLIAEKFKLKEEEQKPVFTRKEGRCDICGEYFEDLNDTDGMMLCNECMKKQEEELDV